MRDSDALSVDRRKDRAAVWYLAALLVIAATLRLYHLDSFSLWHDEAVTYMTANGRTARDVLKLIPRLIPANPPVDPLIRHEFMRLFGRSTLVFRLPSVIWSVLGLFVIYKAVSEILGQRIGLITATLMAFHPFDVRYAQEGRNYAILNVLVPLATLFLWRALKTNRWSDWAIYLVALIACFYSHMLTLGVALGQAFFGVGMIINSVVRRQRVRDALAREFPFALCGLLYAAAVLPYLLFFKSLAHSVSGPRPPGIIVHDTRDVLLTFLFQFPNSMIWLAIIPAIGFLAAYRRSAMAATLLAVTLVTTYALSLRLTRFDFFVVRYVFCVLWIFVAFFACGIDAIARFLAARFRMPARLSASFMTGAIVLSCIPILIDGYLNPFDLEGDTRSAAKFVAERFLPNDLIVVPKYRQEDFGVYSKLRTYGFLAHPEESLIVHPHEVPGKLTRRDFWVIQYNDAKPEQRKQLLEFLNSNPRRRIWLVWNGGFKLDDWRQLVSILDEFGSVGDQRDFKGIDVRLYQPDAP